MTAIDIRKTLHKSLLCDKLSICFKTTKPGNKLCQCQNKLLLSNKETSMFGTFLFINNMLLNERETHGTFPGMELKHVINNHLGPGTVA